MLTDKKHFVFKTMSGSYRVLAFLNYFLAFLDSLVLEFLVFFVFVFPFFSKDFNDIESLFLVWFPFLYTKNKQGKVSTEVVLGCDKSPPCLPREKGPTKYISVEVHSVQKKHDHPFQNHYTHKIIIFELFRGLQLQLSGVFRIN